MISINRMEKLSLCELTTTEVYDVFAREFCSSCLECLPFDSKRMRGIDSIFYLVSLDGNGSKSLFEVSSLFVENGKRRLIFADPELGRSVEVVYSSDSDEVSSDVNFFIKLLGAVGFDCDKRGGGCLSLDRFRALHYWSKYGDHSILSIKFD